MQTIDPAMTKTWVVTLRWVMSGVSIAILAAFAVRSVTKEDWLGAALFGLVAVAVAVSQLVSNRRMVLEGSRGRRQELLSDQPPHGEDASFVGRLNEFGWNALPVYLAVLGAVFVVSGIAVGDPRSIVFGGVLVGLSIFKRRTAGAWYRRF